MVTVFEDVRSGHCEVVAVDSTSPALPAPEREGGAAQLSEEDKKFTGLSMGEVHVYCVCTFVCVHFCCCLYT